MSGKNRDGGHADKQGQQQTPEGALNTYNTLREVAS